MLIWLPEHGHEINTYTPSKSVYIPTRVFSDSSYCYCGLQKADPEDEKCYFCGDPLTNLIDGSIQQGKILNGLV